MMTQVQIKTFHVTIITTNVHNETKKLSVDTLQIIIYLHNLVIIILKN